MPILLPSAHLCYNPYKTTMCSISLNNPVMILNSKLAVIVDPHISNTFMYPLLQCYDLMVSECCLSVPLRWVIAGPVTLSTPHAVCLILIKWTLRPPLAPSIPFFFSPWLMLSELGELKCWSNECVNTVTGASRREEGGGEESEEWLCSEARFSPRAATGLGHIRFA